jgi:hypothetical protein
MTLMLRLMLAMAVGLVLSGCDRSPGAPTGAYNRDTLDAKYQAISDTVKLPVCSTSQQCGSMGIGSKPCGGPWRYIVYSKVSVHEEELKRRVDELFAFEHEYNRHNGIVSDCSVARPAEPACVDGMCVDLNSPR